MIEAKREAKKKKAKTEKSQKQVNISVDMTIEQIKNMFPEMSFRDALNALAAHRRGE